MTPHAAIIASGRLVIEGPEAAVWPWWSFTKTSIAALALRLDRAGVVALDDPCLEDGTTLRDLLLHRAGVANYTDWPDYRSAVAAGDTPWSRAEVIDRALAMPRDFPLRAGWRYSNSGYALAVSILETRAGADLPALLQDHVLGPAGVTAQMPDTAEALAEATWTDTGGYHPHWVYHGLLIGTPAMAARLLHYLVPDLPAQPIPLGGAIPGRPWTVTGYAEGQMFGRMESGPARGHSGCGPFSTCAVYHFPDSGRTVATFTPGADEAPAEWQCVERGAGGTDRLG